MMIEPPIDKLVDKVGCKYALVCVLSKRVRYLLDKRADMLESTRFNPVTYAAKEFYTGGVEAREEE
ncbi:MAG: DNA-directed RNA polymerase subunit omega [Clostridiales bacterium]|jgi:DNA-directed RNA polymerase omega subunit|nr:DNA-directed RNA polymerase subunit omega [Clostridiales bacterium]